MFVGEAALLGDRRRFPAVLIVPNFDSAGRVGKRPRAEYDSRAKNW